MKHSVLITIYEILNKLGIYYYFLLFYLNLCNEKLNLPKRLMKNKMTSDIREVTFDTGVKVFWSSNQQWEMQNVYCTLVFCFYGLPSKLSAEIIL